MELDTLVHCMNTLRRKNSFHAPTRFRLFGKNNKCILSICLYTYLINIIASN